MFKRIAPLLTICLLAATPAYAQFGGGGGGGVGGGGGGGGGHRHGGGNGNTPSTSPTTAPADAPPAAKAPTPTNQIEIVGVVDAIDATTDRVTISYQATDALNWPAGTTPFVASKSALLKDLTVGEKVRFKLDSQQISEIKPF